MFLPNKYTTHYFKLVHKAKNRIKIDGYIERHHIIPKSISPEMSKDKNNIVALTAKEHYIAHLLLTKMCMNKKSHYKMVSALCRMAYSNHITNERKYMSATGYELTRKIISKTMSEKQSVIVSCYNDLGIRIKTFPSITQAAKEFGINGTTINGSLKSKNKWNIAAGYYWRYGNDEKANIVIKPINCRINTKHTLETKIKLGKGVNQYSKDGLFLASFPTATIAANTTNTPKMSICDVLKGRQKTAGGFIWSYLNEDCKAITPSLKCKPILQLSMNGDIIQEWTSCKEALSQLGISNLSRALKNKHKSAGGFKWKYK